MADAPNAGPPAFNEKLAAQVEALVLKRIEANQLELPTMPVTAMKALEQLKKPNFTFKGIAGTLEYDPMLVARVLKVATSAAYATGGKTPSLSDALTRIGEKGVKTIIVEAAAEKIFNSRNTKIMESAKKVWQHSLAVAMLARDIAALTNGKDAEAAYLAGLLHDVGKPIVATILLEAERQITEYRNKTFIESAEWTWVVRKTHRPVGIALCEKWQLPTAIARTVRECSEYDPSDRGAVGNSVCFANALAKSEGYAEDGADIDDARALVMIGRSMLGVDDGMIAPLVANLKQKVGAIYE